MEKAYIRILLICAAITIASSLYSLIFAQIGINIETPDTSAILHIHDVDRGVLFPSADDEEIIIKPTAEGLMFYHVNQNTIFIYDGTNWNKFVKADIQGNVELEGTISAENYKLEDNTVTINTNVVIEENNLQVEGSLEVENTAAFHEDVTVEGTISALNYGLNAEGNGPVPQGGIIMWSGSVSNIPFGWALCDGTNGTPDLRGRFILGRNDDSESNTGGETTHRHQVNSHSHWTNIGQCNIQNYRHGKVVTDLIGYDNVFMPSSGYIYVDPPNTQSTSSSPYTNYVEHLPPYYRLAYIMKL